MKIEHRAFPSNAIDSQFGGMSLHEWFAGQALAGWLATYVDEEDHPGDPENDPENDYPANIARFSYRMADAMMAERKKRMEASGD